MIGQCDNWWEITTDFLDPSHITMRRLYGKEALAAQLELLEELLESSIQACTLAIDKLHEFTKTISSELQPVDMKALDRERSRKDLLEKRRHLRGKNNRHIKPHTIR